MPVEDGEWDEQYPTPPADSANLGTTSFGPGVETPLAGDSPISEPHPETLVEMSESADTKTEPIPEFDPKVHQDFEGLLYLGRLTDQFTWLGHRFLIRSLSAGEILEVGLLHKPYVGSLADVKAYQAAVVAACVLEVDGKPMPVPLTNERTDTSLVNRFDYLLRSWFPPTLDAIYERYLLLEARVEEVIEAMGKAPGSTEQTRSLNGTSA
jgi:hypothetical protein